MKVITKKPKTKAEFVRYHNILWGAIIKELRKKTFVFVNSTFPGIYLKRKVFERIFGNMVIRSICFGCEWSGPSCDNCLFDIEWSGGACIDGYWHDFEKAIDDKDKYEAITLAKIIRDFPVKKGRRSKEL